MEKRKCKLAASLICANILHLEKEVKILEKSQIDLIHFDVMDGVFVPRLGLFPEMLRTVNSATSIPLEVHMMVINPEPYIRTFIQAGADRIIIHAEATRHLHRVIQHIKENGAEVGVALNPATPLNILDYILEDLDLVLLMAINPGIVGHKLIQSVLKKIVDLKQKLTNNSKVMVEVDGGITFENAREVAQKGADIIVCGSQSIFKPDSTINKRIKELRQAINVK